ncbi:MAG: SPOR domain-containing protein, partial [Alphaproteobacteria bacterium]|nr:SPOR domain-containing protein [Alphaproteobacteria bacterium]
AAVPLVKAIPADAAAAPDQTTKSIPKPPAMNVATASTAKVSPSLGTKVPDAGAKAPETVVAPVVASVAVKGYRLQLGSFRSLDGAETLRARLLKEHHDLLLDVELVVETVTVPERGDFFRVNSRPVPDREMVDETCLRLAIRDVPCLLVSVP